MRPLRLLAMFVFVGGVTSVPALAEPIGVETLRTESGESQAEPVARALAAGLEEDQSAKLSPGAMSRRSFFQKSGTAVGGVISPGDPTAVPDVSHVVDAATAAIRQWRTAAKKLRASVGYVEQYLNPTAPDDAMASLMGQAEGSKSPAFLADQWELPRVAEAAHQFQPYRRTLQTSSQLNQLRTDAIEAEREFRTAAARWLALQRTFSHDLTADERGQITANAQEMTQLIEAATEHHEQMGRQLLTAHVRDRLQAEKVLPMDGALEAPSVVGPLDTDAQRAGFVRDLVRPLLQPSLTARQAAQDAKFGRADGPPLDEDPATLDAVTERLARVVLRQQGALEGREVLPSDDLLEEREGVLDAAFDRRAWRLWGDMQQAWVQQMTSRGIDPGVAQAVVSRARPDREWLESPSATPQDAYDTALRESRWQILEQAPGDRYAQVLEAVSRLTPQEIEQQVLPDVDGWINRQSGEVSLAPGSQSGPQKPRPASVNDVAGPATWSSEAMAPLKAAWARWPNREAGARFVPWATDPGAPHPPVLILYAPETWWDTLRAALPAGAVAFASPEALVPGAEGILLVDATTDPATLPGDRPVALRVAKPDDLWRPDDPARETLTPAVLLDRLWYVATQPVLRGEVVLWVPESAQPVEWNSRQFLTLAVEA